MKRIVLALCCTAIDEHQIDEDAQLTLEYSLDEGPSH
jgi:hypothetical protein